MTTTDLTATFATATTQDAVTMLTHRLYAAHPELVEELKAAAAERMAQVPPTVVYATSKRRGAWSQRVRAA